MKMYEIKEMTNEELLKRIDEEEQNLTDLRFQHELKNLTNTAKLGLVRKDIARMRTVLKEREEAEAAKVKEETKEGAN